MDYHEPRGVYRCLECEYVVLGPGAPADCPLCGGCVERLPASLVTVTDVLRARRQAWRVMSPPTNTD
jgi:hypothetical protein